MNSYITSYERTQKQPKIELLDSSLCLSIGSVWFVLGSFFYYCSEDRTEIRKKGHPVFPYEMQKDPRSDVFFIADFAVRRLIKAGQEKDDPAAHLVASLLMLSWGACLREKEWYKDACCKKYFSLRNQLEQYLNSLSLCEVE